MDTKYKNLYMLYSVIVSNGEHKAPIRAELNECNTKIKEYIESIVNDNEKAEKIYDNLFDLYVPVIDLYCLDSFAKGILFSKELKNELNPFKSDFFYY